MDVLDQVNSNERKPDLHQVECDFLEYKQGYHKSHHHEWHRGNLVSLHVIICRLSLLVSDFVIWLLRTTSFDTPHKTSTQKLRIFLHLLIQSNTADRLLAAASSTTWISSRGSTAFKLNKLHKNLSNSPAQYYDQSDNARCQMSIWNNFSFVYERLWFKLPSVK